MTGVQTCALPIFIASSYGNVLKTTDGGNTWQQYQAGDGNPFFSIDVIDSLHIAGGGYNGKNAYSSDGGISWVQGDNSTLHDINDIEYINTETGYIVTYYGLFKTTDRGQSWNGVTGNIGDFQMALLPENVGYSVGEGLNIYKADNGFDNWRKLIINDNFSDVYFTTEQKGFSISSGIGGKLFKTENGGTDWQVVSGEIGRAHV